MPSIKVLLDGIVGSGAKHVDGKNVILLAIARAQIRIMREGIENRNGALILPTQENETAQQGPPAAGSVPLIVICNDFPSGMDEDGKWMNNKGYLVNYLITSGWPKKMINNKKKTLLGTKVIALNMKNGNENFVQALQHILTSLNEELMIVAKQKPIPTTIPFTAVGKIPFS